MWNNTLWRLLGALTIVVLSASACGSDDTSTDTTDTSMADDATTEMTDDHSDDHESAMIDIDASMPIPAVAIALSETGEAGTFDLVVSLTNFTITPDNVDGDPIDNEGHMHLLIDGVKIERFTETERQVMVPEGEHLVEVELNANNHSAYAVDGVPIRAGSTVTGSGDGYDAMAMDGLTADDADVNVEVSFIGGEVTVESADSPVDSGRLDLGVGSVVMIMITSDVADEAHLHGYDVLADVAVGEPAMMLFAADTPGRFELEFENSGIFIAELSVS